jgi:hypothetical protein
VIKVHAIIPSPPQAAFRGGLAASGASIESRADREKKHGALHRL